MLEGKIKSTQHAGEEPDSEVVDLLASHIALNLNKKEEQKPYEMWSNDWLKET